MEPYGEIVCLDEFEQYVSFTEDGNSISIRVDGVAIMEGATVRIKLSDKDGKYSTYIECKVVTLV